MLVAICTPWNHESALERSEQPLRRLITLFLLCPPPQWGDFLCCCIVILLTRQFCLYLPFPPGLDLNSSNSGCARLGSGGFYSSASIRAWLHLAKQQSTSG